MLASELLAVQAAKTFVVLRDRNAWHGTTSRMYKGQVSVTADLATARSVAVKSRVVV